MTPKPLTAERLAEIEETGDHDIRIKELLAAEAYWRAAVRDIDFYGSEFCPWCRKYMLHVDFGGDSHEPTCQWLLAVAVDKPTERE